MNRPLETDWRSHATLASVIGLRENATAMAVPSSISVVRSAASTCGKNGSWFVSAVHAPEYPPLPSPRRTSPAVASEPPIIASTFMGRS